MMNKLLARASVALAFMTLPGIASAQGQFGFPQSGGDASIINRLQQFLRPIEPTGPFDLGQFFITIFNYLILIAGVLAIFYLIWAGIQYITASTDEDKAKKAKTGIFNAIIGIVVIILSYAIISWVSGIVKSVAPGTTRTAPLLQNQGRALPPQ